MARKANPAKLLSRLAHLQSRLTEVEDTLDAIRSGSVDALVVRTPRGEQLFTLRGADHTYRALVEAMNEGAVTLNGEIISYCNNHFARMTRSPLEKVIGTSIFLWVQSPEFRARLRALQEGRKQRGSIEAQLRAVDGTEVPVLLSASRFSSDGNTALSLVVTDITERKVAERARRELSRRILDAQELERKRVARDLHDGVNQLLSSAKYRLSTSSHQAPKAARQSVEQARLLVEKAIAEVRSIGRNLRPSELDDLGLVAALRSLAHESESRSGIAVQFRTGAVIKVPAELEMALYRIAQEALNNVARHAQASRAELSVAASPTRIELTVRDNGKGLSGRKSSDQLSGWGLRNMKERAALLGGTFSLEALPIKVPRYAFAFLFTADHKTLTGQAMKQHRKIKLLLADDHALVREGIRSSLLRHPSIKIIGEAVNGRDALRKAKRLEPDVVLMDVNMPEMTGLEATPLIRQTCPTTKVIALTVHDNKEYVFQILRNGANGYVLKDTSPDELIRAIEAVVRNGAFFSPRISQMILEEAVQSPAGNGRSLEPNLSQREMDVLRSISEGSTSKEIASLLKLSVRTVETYRVRIKRKLNARNTAELLNLARRRQLL